MDEPTVKNLTSDDLITARGMRQDFFQFAPTHKLVLQTNHKPRLRGTDHGIRRRLRLVPFDVKFWKDADQSQYPNGAFPPEFRADPDLTRRLLSQEQEGILADMVTHAKAFYEAGMTLTPPCEVLQATAEYIRSEDIIGQFFEACVKEDPDGEVKAAAFYQRFKEWAKAEGHDEKRLPSPTRFGSEAGKRFEKVVKTAASIYRVSLSPSL